MFSEGLFEGTFHGSLVGRDAEMRKLLSLLDASSRSEGSLVLVEGEAGIGKTRLISELAKHAKAQGASFYSGKCLYSDGSDPYLPFIDALRGEVESEKAYAPQLAIFGLGGNEKETARMISEGTIGDITREKTQVYETVLQHIQRLADRTPVVFFLDDLHMADASSLQLFYYIARNTQRARVMLVGAYRPEELSDESGKNRPLVELIQRMSRERFYNSIKLGRLKAYEVTKMLSSIFGSEYLPLGFSNFVFSKTDGNPFYVEEVVKALIDDGVIGIGAEHAGEKVDFSHVSIPTTIEDIITRRLDGLDDESYKILEIASAIGRDFQFEILLRTLEMDEVELLDRLDKLMAQKIVREDTSTDEERYSFDHTMLQEVVYANLTKSKRRLLHAKIGTVIESIFNEKVRRPKPEHIYMLSRHFTLGGEHEKALRYSAMAGDRSMSVYALDEALKFYEQAFENAEKVTGNLEVHEKKLELLIMMGKVRTTRGEWEEGIQAYNKLLKLADTDEYRLYRAIAHRNIGHILRQRSDWQNAIRAFETALQTSESVSDKHGIADSFRGMGWVYWRLGKSEEAFQCYNSCIEYAEEVGATTIITAAYIDIGNVHSSIGNYGEAIEYFEIALELLDDIGNLPETARVCNNIGATYFYLEEYDKALEQYGKCIEIASKCSDYTMLAYGYSNIGEVHVKRRNFDRAREYLDKALEMFEKMDDQHMLSSVYRYYGTASRLQKKYEESQKFFKLALDKIKPLGIIEDMAHCNFELALLYKEMGKKDECVASLKEALRLYKELDSKKFIQEVENELAVLEGLDKPKNGQQTSLSPT